MMHPLLPVTYFACQSMVTMVHFFRKKIKEDTKCYIRVKDRCVNINTSIRRLTNLFIILFIALSGGLVYWQVVVAQQVTSNTYSAYARRCASDNAPKRGSIFDRNGVLLAYSKPSNNPRLCGYQRFYTQDAQSLSNVIGYYISPLYGSTGIEQQYNAYLNGQVGSTGLNNTINQILHLPPVGDDIYLY